MNLLFKLCCSFFLETLAVCFSYLNYRGSIRCFVNTIHLLQNLPEIASLPVTSVLTRLRELEGGVGCWSSLLGNKHISCWGFEDMLTCASRKENSDKEKGYNLVYKDRESYVIMEMRFQVVNVTVI